MLSIFRIKLLSAFALLLASSLAASAKQESKPVLAEKAADQIVQRFNETLDFGVIYNEMYVKNDRIRRAEVEIIVGNLIASGNRGFGGQWQPPTGIDFAAKERAYLAQANFHWLSAAAFAAFKGDKEKFNKEMGEAWTKYYQPLNEKSSWPMLTTKELDERFTERMKAFSFLFLKYIDKNAFDSEEYHRWKSSIEEDKPPDSLEDLKELFRYAGMKKDENLYVVRRGRFYIYLLEENDEFRMFSYTSRIRW
jgi:hypothetical protein